MATAGRVLLMSKGAWVSGTSYSPMDYVYYGGNSYVCKSASSGTTTPDNDTTHWQLMASGFDMDMITQTITNEQNKIASDAAVYAETVKLEAQDAALAADIATVETTSTASKAYAVGDYLVYNNQLYRVTSAIASGGTLTVGTNISATSAGGELTSIKDAFPNSAWKGGKFASSCDVSVTPPKTGLYLMFITANPSAANVTTTVSLLYGSSTLNTKTNVGANGSYGGVTAIGIISVTDTTRALRFTASNAASNDNYNLYGCCYLGPITNQMS